MQQHQAESLVTRGLQAFVQILGFGQPNIVQGQQDVVLRDSRLRGRPLWNDRGRDQALSLGYLEMNSCGFVHGCQAQARALIPAPRVNKVAELLWIKARD